MAARQGRDAKMASMRAQGLKTAEERTGKRVYQKIWAEKLKTPEFKALSPSEQESMVINEWKSRVTIEAAKPKVPKPPEARRDNKRGGGSGHGGHGGGSAGKR